MNVAYERPVAPINTPSAPAIHNGRWAGYRHLLGARLLELKREPEVVFWVFVFPLLLALGLGIAFRNKPGDAVSVAIVAGSGSQDAQSLLARSPQHDLFKIKVLNADDARLGFRLGKFDLVIEPNPSGGVEYRYDPARPESVLARAEVNDALQAASGRKDMVATTTVTSSEPGSRYIDFLIPGLLGMNLMNSGMWGIGFALVDMRQRKLLKRYVGTPMRRGDFLLAIMTSRLLLMIIEIGLLLVFGVIFFHMRVLGSVFSIAAIGGLGGLAQIGNNGSILTSDTQIRNGISSQTSQEAEQILNHFINRLPVITVKEGSRARVYINQDILIPSYAEHRVDSAL